MNLGSSNHSDVLSSNLSINLISASWFNVLGFLGVWIIIWLPIALLLSQRINWQPQEVLTPKQKLILLASLYILAPGIIAWKVNTESLTWIDLGLSFNSSNLLFILLGLGVSIFSLVIIFSLESLGNLVTWHWQNLREIPTLCWPILGLSLLISLVEEVIFRGYIFITLLADNSFWLAAIASSMIFAGLHLIWERKQTLPQLPGLWLMGMVLVAARILTNDTLYLAIGLHGGWIWGLTCIDSANLLTYKYPNHWFTGLNQQPLAGMAGILCLILTGLGIWIFSY
ncbi:MAG: lysostaphin resistance A-like protein [Waterburya sp.]